MSEAAKLRERIRALMASNDFDDETVLDVAFSWLGRRHGSRGGRPPKGGLTPLKGVSLSGSDQDQNSEEEGKGGLRGLKGVSAFDSLLADLAAAWTDAKRAPYAPTPGDRKNLGVMVRALDKAAWADVVPAFKRYLNDADPFLAKQGHGIAYFCTSGGLNKYRAAANDNKPREVAVGERDSMGYKRLA